MREPLWRSTTILTVRTAGGVAIGGDGQVTFNNTILKADTRKIRRLVDGKVLCGFAGSTADAFALLERFEAKVKDYPGNLVRAATELARDWRTDRALRRLEAMLAVVDAEVSLVISGSGEVIEPDDGVIGIGSGGAFAAAAAKALQRHARHMAAASIAEESLKIASEVCIYTNDHITVLEIDSSEARA